MKLAVYDMDKTIIGRASWTAWLMFYARTEAPARLLLAPLMLVPLAGFLLGALDRKGLKEATHRIMLGRAAPRAKVARAAGRFADSFGARQELPGALAAIERDRSEGYETLLATASPHSYVDALARRWGFDHVVATRNVWHGDSITPKILGENCYEMGKLRMLLAHLEARPERTRFVSDHPSDLPVFLWADEVLVANPPAGFRRIAALRGWPVCDWAQGGQRTAQAGSPDTPRAPAGSP